MCVESCLLCIGAVLGFELNTNILRKGRKLEGRDHHFFNHSVHRPYGALFASSLRKRAMELFEMFLRFFYTWKTQGIDLSPVVIDAMQSSALKRC